MATHVHPSLGWTPCVQWCPTSHPSLGWLFCEKWWKNILNHQIELFCNKCRPWLAMVWVIPGWDDPHWPTFNMPPMQNIVRPVVAMHKKHVHLKLIMKSWSNFGCCFFRSWQHMFIPVWDEPMCAMVPHKSSQSGMTFLWSKNGGKHVEPSNWNVLQQV